MRIDADISTLLRDGGEKLKEAGIPEPFREATHLLCFAGEFDRTFIIAHPEYVPAPEIAEKFDEFINRRANREPFHYIIGKKEFYGLEFLVGPAVLIPRPETEMLVERAIELLEKVSEPRFCEIGVGSGCISVSILKNVPNSMATATDISEAAIEIARLNTAAHGVADRCSIIRSDVFAGIGDKTDATFDLIVSNPPYIPAEDIEGLEKDVKDFEPATALTDGGDGLSIIRRLVLEAPRFLNSGGSILIEIGIGQADDVTSMFDTNVWEEIEIVNDLQGIPRMTSARII